MSALQPQNTQGKKGLPGLHAVFHVLFFSQSRDVLILFELRALVVCGVLEVTTKGLRNTVL